MTRASSPRARRGHLRRTRLSRAAGVSAVVSVCWLGALGPLSSRAKAGDALDAAVERAEQAAAREDWEAATRALEDAYALLPGPSAALEYDLGTAYAHVGEFGYASAHLRRAVELGLTSETLEAARRNQGIVRRRAEIAAAVNGTTLSPPSAWSARIEDLLARSWIGALALTLGLLHVLLVTTWVWLRRTTGMFRLAMVCAFTSATLLAAHVWAITRPPQVVVLHDVEFREGPGEHRDVTTTVQASSVGVVIEENGRWLKVRVTDEVAGWTPAAAVARFPVGVPATTEPPLPTRRARLASAPRE